MSEPESITCPECKRVSYHKADIKNKFCIKCGWHKDLVIDLKVDTELKDNKKGNVATST